MWQHSGCVQFDAAAAAGGFLCGGCRVARADPFWRPINTALAPPARLVHPPGHPQRPGGGWDERLCHLKNTFSLSHAWLDSLRAGQDCQLQARLREPLSRKPQSCSDDVSSYPPARRRGQLLLLPESSTLLSAGQDTLGRTASCRPALARLPNQDSPVTKPWTPRIVC